MCVRIQRPMCFNDTATTEIYTLSLHDALPICRRRAGHRDAGVDVLETVLRALGDGHHVGGQELLHRRREVVDVDPRDRKSTRLNSSHANISYAVFCLKKKRRLLFVITSISTLF